MIDLYPQEITRVFLNLIGNGFYAAAKRKEGGEEGFEPKLTAITKNSATRSKSGSATTAPESRLEVKEKMFNPFFTTKPAGEGHRAWPVDEPRHRGETTWRHNRRRYRTRRIYRIHYYAAANGGGWRHKLSVYILVVDDEPDVEALFRQQFRRDLKSGRFTMEFAPSAPAALERAAEVRDPSLILILSDINMPGMSGLEMPAEGARGAARRSRDHDHRLWRRRNPPQGDRARRGRPSDQADRFCAAAP